MILAWVHRIGFIEGLSAFVLICIAVPMKRIFHTIGAEEFYWIGLVHGVLWVVYAIVATIALYQKKITVKQYFLLAFLSLFPLGPILADRYILKERH